MPGPPPARNVRISLACAVEMLNCPYCGFDNASSAEFCANCRKYLGWDKADAALPVTPPPVTPPPVTPPPVTPPPVTPSVATAPCPRCSFQVPADKSFCPNCGLELASWVSQQPVQPVVPQPMQDAGTDAGPRALPPVAIGARVGRIAAVALGGGFVPANRPGGGGGGGGGGGRSAPGPEITEAPTAEPADTRQDG